MGRRSRLFGICRVLLLLLLLLVASSLLCLPALEARVGREFLAIADHLQVLASGKEGPAGGERRLYLNGQKLDLEVRMDPRVVDELITAGQENCRNGMVMHQSEGKRGFSACLSLDGFRFESFLQVMDAGRSQTRVVDIAAKGGISIAEMFPMIGDAPGFDLSGLSRPPQSRRVLSGGEVGLPNALAIYESETPRADLRALRDFYDRDIAARGWTLLRRDDSFHGGSLYFVERGGELRLIMLSKSEANSEMVIIASAQ